MDLNQDLSDNFQLWEFVTSQTASREGIDNTPPLQIVENLKKLCERILEPARFALGPLRISSGYRCTQLNKLVGGSATSGHPLGFCADVIPLKVSKMEFARWISRNCKFDQIILEFGKKDNPDWIHVSADPKSRNQVLQILHGTGYVPVKL